MANARKAHATTTVKPRKGLFGLGKQAAVNTTTIPYRVIPKVKRDVVTPKDSEQIYNTIKSPFPYATASENFQAGRVAELGQQITLGGTSRVLSSVTLCFATWGYRSKYPNAPDANWNTDITLNIYAINPNDPTLPGQKLFTYTKNFTIEWRPEPDPSCGGTMWLAPDGCHNSMAFVLDFDGLDALGPAQVTLPDELIFSIAFNTQDAGYSPIGVETPSNDLAAAVNTAVTLPENKWLNSTEPTGYADGGAAGIGVFRLDVGIGDYPVIQIAINAEVAAATTTQPATTVPPTTAPATTTIQEAPATTTVPPNKIIKKYPPLLVDLPDFIYQGATIHRKAELIEMIYQPPVDQMLVTYDICPYDDQGNKLTDFVNLQPARRLIVSDFEHTFLDYNTGQYLAQVANEFVPVGSQDLNPALQNTDYMYDYDWHNTNAFDNLRVFMAGMQQAILTDFALNVWPYEPVHVGVIDYNQPLRKEKKP